MLSGYCLGFCPWDLTAFLLAVGILAVIVVHNVKFKKNRKGFLQKLEKKNRIHQTIVNEETGEAASGHSQQPE